MPPTFSTPPSAPRYRTVGDIYTLLLTGRQTGNVMALIHGLVSPGFGPPPHAHSREDELFYVLSGEITFFAGAGPTARPVVAHAGDSIFLPRNEPHSFKNTGSTPAEVLIEVFPGGNFDAYIEKVGQLLTPNSPAPIAPPTPEEIATVLAHGPAFGITFHL